MKRKLLFFFGLVVFMTVLFTMPAAAMCDECVDSEEQVSDYHCEARCDCYYDECPGCGENSMLVYCDLEHEPNFVQGSQCKNYYIDEICDYCGTSFTKTVLGQGHNYVTNTVAATCTSSGYSEEKCSRCSDVKNKVNIPALGHNYVTNTVAATCTDGGYTSHICSRCDDSYTTDATPPTGHKWVTDSETTATCTAGGRIEQSCSSCGETQVDTIDPLGHDYEAKTIDATCTESGYTKYSCTRCDDYYTSDETPELGHDYRASVVEPDCTSGGYTMNRCSRCSHSYTSDQTSALGHNYVAGTCTRCQAEDPDYVPPDCDHQWVTDSTTDATCTTDGREEQTCSKCGETQVDIIDALGHNYVAGSCTRCQAEDPDYVPPDCDHTWVTDSATNATCTTDGRVEQTCSKCGETQVDIIDALGHNYVDGTCTRCQAEDPDYVPPDCDHTWVTSTTEPTCTVNGQTVKICSECGEKTTTTLFAPGHRYVEGICSVCCAVDETYTPSICDHVWQQLSYQAPTCTEAGKRVDKCSLCSETKTIDLSAIGHKYVGAVVEPTCTVQGYTIYTCSACRSTYRDNYVDATGHTEYSTVKTAATCETEGYTTYTCMICSHTWQADKVKALGHNLINNVCTRCGFSSECEHVYTETVVAAKCEEQGYTLYSCTKCGNGYYDNYTPALTHVWKVTETKAATCEAQGYTHSTCNLCGEVKTDNSPALGHKWLAGNVNMNEDNTAVVAYSCSVCNETKTETVPTAAAQAQNWLLTSIRGFSGALIEMYETVANGVEIGGVTAGEVVTGTLILCCFVLFAWFFVKMRK